MRQLKASSVTLYVHDLIEKVRGRAGEVKEIGTSGGGIAIAGAGEKIRKRTRRGKGGLDEKGRRQVDERGTCVCVWSSTGGWACLE